MNKVTWKTCLGSVLVIAAGVSAWGVATNAPAQATLPRSLKDIAIPEPTNLHAFLKGTRDFVKQCTNPVLILPDDIPAHPYKVAMEAAMLAPNAEVSMFPWKEPKERIPLAIRQIRSFLRAHRIAP